MERVYRLLGIDSSCDSVQNLIDSNSSESTEESVIVLRKEKTLTRSAFIKSVCVGVSLHLLQSVCTIQMSSGMPDGKVCPEQFRGWLLKWTNYIKGYQRRWFVLANGLLSYYRCSS